MRHTCYTLLTLLFVYIYLHFWLQLLLIKNAPHLLHFAYTSVCPHCATHLLIKNAPQLLHFAYTSVCPHFATLWLHFWVDTFSYTITNKKCATFVTLCLHFCLSTFTYTSWLQLLLIKTHCIHFYLHHLLNNNVSHLLHFGYTLCYTLLHQKAHQNEENEPQHLGFPCGPPPWY